MSGAVPVRTKKELAFPAVLEMRRVRGKLELFSPGVLLFAAAMLLLASLLTLDSYWKSYRNAQMLRLTSQLDITRFENFRKTDLETQYLRLVSTPALLKHAEGLNLRPATKDRIFPL